jgi:hypothetical protein
MWLDAVAVGADNRGKANVAPSNNKDESFLSISPFLRDLVFGFHTVFGVSPVERLLSPKKFQ